MAVWSRAFSKRLDCPIVIPSEEEEACQAISRRLEKIVYQILTDKQRIKSLLLQYGIAGPKGLCTWRSAAVGELKK